jgi:branched-chain amino acid transport system permease protein
MNIIHALRDKMGGWGTLVILLVVGAILPFIGLPSSILLYLFIFFLYYAMANMWNLLAGYSGLVSLCQPAFIGIAGYILAILTWKGLPLYVSMIGGGAIAAVFALVISYPVFRLSGIYFAIGTLVLPEALRVIFLNWKPEGVGGSMQGGGAGYTILGTTSLSGTETYWMALAIAIVSAFVLRVVLRSKLGVGLAAIRDSERTAASSGINNFSVKMYTFLISAAVTGIAGAIFFASQQYIEPVSAFSINWTMIVILSTVIGGMGTQTGPAIGAAIITVMYFTLSRYGGISLLIQGVILIAIMLLVPEGIAGYISKMIRRRRGSIT